MTTRETSRESYRQLVESGQLKGKQADVLRAIVEHGPGTAAELLQGTPMDRNRNLARARFTELAARGLIVEVEQRKCTVTGRTALVWEYSGRVKALKPKHRTGGKELRALLKRALPIITQLGESKLGEEIREALR